MKKETRFIAVLAGLVLATACYAQEAFTNCTAAFLDEKLVVDEYSPTGKCILKSYARGILTVCTADLSPTGSKPVDRLSFKIAIRDRNTGTLVMFSDKTYRRVPIQEVLAQCRPGDKIVLLTLDRHYAMPHNEILIE